MLRLKYLFTLLVGVSFAFACQGEQGVPSGPGGGLDLSAGGPCKNNAFTAAVAIYVDSNTQNTKLQACKDILALVKQDKVVPEAELAIVETGGGSEQFHNRRDIDGQLPFVGAPARCRYALGGLVPPRHDAARERLDDQHASSALRTFAELMLDATASNV